MDQWTKWVSGRSPAVNVVEGQRVVDDVVGAPLPRSRGDVVYTIHSSIPFTRSVQFKSIQIHLRSTPHTSHTHPHTKVVQSRALFTRSCRFKPRFKPLTGQCLHRRVKHVLYICSVKAAHRIHSSADTPMDQ